MKLKKFLIPFLLCNIICFSFIPKTYATSINEFEMLFSANVYTLDGKFALEILGDDHTYLYGGIPVFFGYEINNINFSKQCNYSYTYRVDYQIWGFHNTNADWRDFAQLIQVNHTDINTIGTVIQVVDDYHLNLSTFFTWIPTYCPVDTINSLRFNVNDYIRTPIQDNFFYNSQYSSGGTNYYIYDKLFSDIDKEVATQLVTNYYGGSDDYKQDLENIKGQLVNTNDKLEETNEKLENIYNTITDTSLDTGKLENSAGWLPPGPVDSILNLPLSLYENLLDILQNGQSCPVLQINLPFVNEVLSIPCLSDIFSKIEGLNVFWTWVGTISGAFLLFNYLINLYKWVDATLTMRENNHFGGY